jgi:hypothetical protein
VQAGLGCFASKPTSCSHSDSRVDGGATSALPAAVDEHGSDGTPYAGHVVGGLDAGANDVVLPADQRMLVYTWLRDTLRVKHLGAHTIKCPLSTRER